MRKPVKIFNEGNFTRMCVSCNSRRHKKDMLRVAVSPDGEIYIDETGKGRGRGCYICRDSECISAAIKNNRISRALKCEIPSEIYDLLKCKSGESNE